MKKKIEHPSQPWKQADDAEQIDELGLTLLQIQHSIVRLQFDVSWLLDAYAKKSIIKCT